MKPVISTKKYAKNSLPKAMVNIPISQDSLNLTFAFRQREGGFYPIGDFVDYSYSQNRNEITMGK